jgi:AraC family transcriptional regulator of adaptative response / DNA-3-methyladenine glycosylase II
MDLDRDQCYGAVRSRDARFDGRFFTAVTTTGVFCRPVCPARTPLLANVRFYPSAAAAQAAGFRPCLRCRPEASPGTPAWRGSAATVSRALRLIEAGALDDGNVEGLAMRLGVGSRHLRRLFHEHLGAPPAVLAQSRRVLFAKTLLDQTELPVTEVAFAAGFTSIRRFNHAFREAYGCPPVALRRARARVTTTGGTTLELSYRAPLDWPALLAFFSGRATPGVETVEGDAYLRTVAVGDAVGVIRVSHAGSGHRLLLQADAVLTPCLLHIVQRARRMFDLGCDPPVIAECLGADPWLRDAVAARPGQRLPGAFSGFEMGVRAILGQQVSVKGASTLCGRLVARYGTKLPGAPRGGLTHVFPMPERLARARYVKAGFPEARALAIRALARAVVDGVVDLDVGTNLDGIIQGLVALPGIGPWTANYLAMRAYGEPDAFPAGDLGLRKACTAPGEPLVPEPALDARSEVWRPWRAYAAMHLWASLPDPGGG